MKKFCLLIAVFTLVFASSALCKSRSTPQNSDKMEGKTSRFSLQDPRVISSKLEELKDFKEPEEKPIPKGGLMSLYSKTEQDAIDIVEDLKKAYDENNQRPDGYGIQIQQEIVGLMGKIRSKRSLNFLTAKLGDDKEIINNKMKIVETLGNIGDAKAKPALEKFLLYLKANKPSDPMAGFTWDQWILKTEEALSKVSAN